MNGYDPRVLAHNNRIALNVASNVLEDAITLNVEIPNQSQKSVTVEKSRTMMLPMQDNKHGGAEVFGGGDFGGGGGGHSFRYTTDNVPEHGAIVVYVNQGGSFAILAKGSPLERPVSGQLSADGKTLWIVDQGNGNLLSVPFPSREKFELLFPEVGEDAE